ncbi:MAG: HTTM domain-containing protein [Steroidobacteraceae bacterium]
MSFADAVHLTELLLGFALALQSIEHLRSQTNERRLFIPRLLLAVLLIIGVHTAWVTAALLLLTLLTLRRFQGPYNGGSDRLGILILCCLGVIDFAPTQSWRDIAFGYLALQTILSYFIAGWVKIVNPDWRSGHALRDVFEFSAYPVSESLRQWAHSPRLLLIMSWAVMLFELLFPVSLLSSTNLYIALGIAASFHLANACLFGLNRFFWTWLAAYPSLIWLQQRLTTGS